MVTVATIGGCVSQQHLVASTDATACLAATGPAPAQVSGSAWEAAYLACLART